jgi:hypothetical protein
MVSKCANPECSATFRYLSQGRLFSVPIERSSSALPIGPHAPRQTEYFWLCDQCAGKLTLAWRQGKLLLLPAAANKGASVAA